MTLKTRTIFISYTHADERFKLELQAHLAALFLLKRASAWSDRDLHPGAFLFEEIKTKIEQADIILLLVSANYLASESCQAEMEAALARHNDGKSITIPVIVRPCEWSILPLGEMLAVPKDGSPVSIAPDRDVAWLDVVRSLRKLLETWVPPREREAEETSFSSDATPEAPVETPNKRGGRWVYRKSENDRAWTTLKQDLAEELATQFDSMLSEGLEDDVRFWGDKLLVDVKHPRFTSTKRLIVDDVSGYPGVMGYQLDIYPGSPLGLAVNNRALRWLRDSDGQDLLAELDGKSPRSITDLAEELVKEAVATGWGKPGKVNGRKKAGN